MKSRAVRSLSLVAAISFWSAVATFAQAEEGRRHEKRHGDLTGRPESQ